jgi:hypothetical protein
MTEKIAGGFTKLKRIFIIAASHETLLGRSNTGVAVGAACSMSWRSDKFVNNFGRKTGRE